MKILFICTGNTCRSPMAEGIFKSIVNNNKDFICQSAGLYCVDGSPATAEAIEVCKEINIDISDHKSSSFNNLEDIESFDYFVVMTNEHANALKSIGIEQDKIKVLGNGIPDPYCMGIETYRKTRDCIKSSLEEFFSDFIPKD